MILLKIWINIEKYCIVIISVIKYYEYILFSCGVSDRSNNTMAPLLDTNDSNTIPFKV